MSRSGYSDDLDSWALIRWRGAVKSACKGNRGQAFFKELLSVLDGIPGKVLAAETLEAQGQFCTIGSVLHARGKPIPNDDDVWAEPEILAEMLGISHAQTAEIIYMNDEGEWRRGETPEARWERMREWVKQQIIVEPVTKAPPEYLDIPAFLRRGND